LGQYCSRGILSKPVNCKPVGQARFPSLDLSSLALEEANAVRRDEKSSDRSVLLVRPKIPTPAVESDDSIRTPRLQNILPRMAVAELLSEVQILIPRDRAEIMAVFLEVIPEQIFCAEALAAGNGGTRAHQKACGKE
jgi:hypothetical protein